MSKARLKKELAPLTKEQLLEVVLGVYSASKEAQEYFEFYLDPNPAQLYEIYSVQIEKEYARAKYGRRSKARISRIKAIIKKFISFNPGIDLVLDLYIHAIVYGARTEAKLDFPPTLLNGIGNLAVDVLKLAGKNDYFTKVLTVLTALARESGASRLYRQTVKEAIERFADDPKNNAGQLK